MSNEEFAIAMYENMEVLFDDNGDPWMTQAQIAELLGVSKQAVSDMLNVAIKGNDIPTDSVINLRLTVANGKTYNVKHYNYDAILIVGFRSKASDKALRFRRWVGDVLRQYTRQLQARNEGLAFALSEEQKEKRTLAWKVEEYEFEQERKNRDRDLYDYNEL